MPGFQLFRAWLISSFLHSHTHSWSISFCGIRVFSLKLEDKYVHPQCSFSYIKNLYNVSASNLYSKPPIFAMVLVPL
jgi:hypothetical protein